jgi:hypothetical protein
LEKLSRVAGEFGVAADLPPAAQARELALALMEEYGIKKGYLQFTKRLPAARLEKWAKLGIAPRGIDWEISEMLHRTHMGVDNDPVNLLLQALRSAIADGWGGSMIATEVSDILFGTPKPVASQVNIGVLKKDRVNIILHGHSPLVSEMVAQAARTRRCSGPTFGGETTWRGCAVRERNPCARASHGRQPPVQELAIVTGGEAWWWITVHHALPRDCFVLPHLFFTTSPRPSSPRPSTCPPRRAGGVGP